MMASDTQPLFEDTEKCYKYICDGFGCSNKASKKIDATAGKYGTISLILCSLCIKKFDKCNEGMKNAESKGY